MQNEVIVGDCADVLKQYEDETFDLVVTDPPYGISFMGKSWDKALPSLEALKECNRVLKAGAFGFFMCAPRMDVLSRMIIRLEDAGFNTGFSSIMWAYACLSSDSEVLTKSGWVSYNQLRNTNKDIYKQLHILTYDIETCSYKWEIPSAWSEYQIEDTCYRIKCDSTDQLVTRNHRVLVEREGELLFRFAETLGQEINVPYVENLQVLFDSLSDIPISIKADNPTGCRELLFDKLQAESEYSEISSPSQRQIQNRRSILDGREKERMVGEDDRREQLGLEGGSDLQKQTWELSNESDQVREESRRVSSNGSPRWMGSYSPSDSSSTDRQTVNEEGSSSPCRPQSGEQQLRESSSIFEQSRSQEIRGRAGYKTCMARVEPEFYRGIVFCPTVKTGCFVARRNGHIFLTGNSGFPKSANVGKLIDKRNGRTTEQYKALGDYLRTQREIKGLSQKDIAVYFPSKTGGLTGCYWNWENSANVPTLEQWGILKELLDLDSRFDELIEREEAEREILATKHKTSAFIDGGGYSSCQDDYSQTDIHITAPATDKAREFSGAFAGCNLKPALEVIITVMKPLECKTYVDQALQNGHGVTWLEDCKIPYESDADKGGARFGTQYDIKGGNWGAKAACKPMAVIGKNKLSSEDGRFPANLLVSDNCLDRGIITKSGAINGFVNNQKTSPCFGVYNPIHRITPANEGDFSRYFSLDAWFDKKLSELPEEQQKTFPFLIVPKPSKSEKNKYIENKHPTVKPLKLMSYLITMGSREGDLILDPFAGSGTTLEACKLLNRRFVGIDLDPENEKYMRARGQLNTPTIESY